MGDTAAQSFEDRMRKVMEIGDPSARLREINSQLSNIDFLPVTGRSDFAKKLSDQAIKDSVSLSAAYLKHLREQLPEVDLGAQYDLANKAVKLKILLQTIIKSGEQSLTNSGLDHINDIIWQIKQLKLLEQSEAAQNVESHAAPASTTPLNSFANIVPTASLYVKLPKSEPSIRKLFIGSMIAPMPSYRPVAPATTSVTLPIQEQGVVVDKDGNGLKSETSKAQQNNPKMIMMEKPGEPITPMRSIVSARQNAAQDRASIIPAMSKQENKPGSNKL